MVLPHKPTINESVFELYAEYESQFGGHLKVETQRPLWIAFFSLGTILGLIGNTIILIASNRRVIKLDKITTTLISHVAILDLINTLIFIFPTFLTVATDHWVFGREFCYFQVYTRNPFIYCSMLLVCALNCSKLASVLLPFRSTNWSVKHGHVTAGAMWLLSAASLLLLLTSSYTVIFFYPLMSCGVILANYAINIIVESTILVVCMAIVVGTTVGLIVIAIRLNFQRGRAANLQGIITVIIVATVYCASFLPTVAYSVTELMIVNEIISDSGGFVEFITRFCAIMRLVIYLNNVSNVLIYYASVISFREWVKTMFLSLFMLHDRERCNEFLRQRGNNRVIPTLREHRTQEGVNLGETTARSEMVMLQELGEVPRARYSY